MPKCPFCGKNESSGIDLQQHIQRKHSHEVVSSTSSQNKRVKSTRSKKNPPIVVDGNNVAYFSGNPPKANYLKRIRSKLIKMEYTPIIIVSAAIRHKIDNMLDLIRMINLNWIIEAESGVDDDILIIEEAQRKRCQIVTNDRYSEYIKEYNTKDWNLKNALITFQMDKDQKFIIL